MSTTTNPDHLQEKTPQKSLDPSFTTLSPVHSHTSALDQAIDAEAGLSSDNNSSPSPQTPKVGGDYHEDPGPPPNGGAKAWLQVAGSFFLFFNCW